MPRKKRQIGRQPKRKRVCNVSFLRRNQNHHNITQPMTDMPSNSIIPYTSTPPEPHQQHHCTSLVNTTISPSSAATSLSSLTTPSGVSSIDTNNTSLSTCNFGIEHLSHNQRKQNKKDIDKIIGILTTNKSIIDQQYGTKTVIAQHCNTNTRFIGIHAD
jgi:hypothetical protein